jgi:riboflavin kinase/FMN adenylyltransferase
MRVVTSLTAVPHPPRRAVVTVGVFDGVHRAHQHLIRSTVRLARRLKGTSVVVTFDPDPHAVLDPDHAPPALTPLHARLAQLRALGVDWVWVIPFTRAFARTRAETFLRRIVRTRLRAAALIVGESFAFGRDRRGNLATLRVLAPALGVQVCALQDIRRGGAPISSSRIRRLIAGGRLAEARRLLGRPPALYGTVVHGAGRGCRLGFPTANIRLTASTLPPRGVYAVLLTTASRRYRGVMNLGVRPTFGPGPLVCEVHLLNFSGRIRGRAVTVSLVAHLRGERCFPSPQALVRQVRRDVSRATRILARLP